jgi:hypothetical protein
VPDVGVLAFDPDLPPLVEPPEPPLAAAVPVLALGRDPPVPARAGVLMSGADASSIAASPSAAFS